VPTPAEPPAPSEGLASACGSGLSGLIVSATSPKVSPNWSPNKPTDAMPAMAMPDPIIAYSDPDTPDKSRINFWLSKLSFLSIGTPALINLKIKHDFHYSICAIFKIYNEF
jgi:hypothetical protein